MIKLIWVNKELHLYIKKIKKIIYMLGKYMYDISGFLHIIIKLLLS